jgi:hypothetical protein
MIEHIQSAMFYQIHSRKFHDLPDLRFILAMVTLGLTFLAHGFGIVGALQPHGQTVGEKPGAIRTKKNFLFLDLLNIQQLKGKRGPLSVMVLPAKDSNESHQCPNIRFLLL